MNDDEGEPFYSIHSAAITLSVMSETMLFARLNTECLCVHCMMAFLSLENLRAYKMC